MERNLETYVRESWSSVRVGYTYASMGIGWLYGRLDIEEINLNWSERFSECRKRLWVLQVLKLIHIFWSFDVNEWTFKNFCFCLIRIKAKLHWLKILLRGLASSQNSSLLSSHISVLYNLQYLFPWIILFPIVFCYPTLLTVTLIKDHKKSRSVIPISRYVRSDRTLITLNRSSTGSI